MIDTKKGTKSKENRSKALQGTYGEAMPEFQLELPAPLIDERGVFSISYRRWVLLIKTIKRRSAASGSEASIDSLGKAFYSFLMNYLVFAYIVNLSVNPQ